MSKRLELLRKARSLNDVLSVLKDLTKEIAINTKNVDTLSESLSATKGTGSIKIDMRLSDGPVTRSKIKPVTVDLTKRTPSGGVKLIKFAVPSLDQLMKHSSTVARLYDNLKELDAIEASLRQAFASTLASKAALRNIAALRVDVKSSLDKTFATLNRIAKKHMPTEMSEFKDALVGLVLDNVSASSYDNLNQLVYASIDDNSNPSFSLYVQLENLTNSAGFTFQSFYIILTGIVHNNVLTYYLNTLPDFKTPGNYPIGKQVKDVNELSQRLKLLLAHNNIVAEFDVRPMPITTKEAKVKGFSKIKNVKDVTVSKDKLTVTIVPTTTVNVEAVRLAVIKDVIALLKSVIGLRSRSTVVYKVLTKSKIEFSLIPKGEKVSTPSVQKLEELQRALDLSDEEVDTIRTALKAHI